MTSAMLAGAFRLNHDGISLKKDEKRGSTNDQLPWFNNVGQRILLFFTHTYEEVKTIHVKK